MFFSRPRALHTQNGCKITTFFWHDQIFCNIFCIFLSFFIRFIIFILLFLLTSSKRGKEKIVFNLITSLFAVISFGDFITASSFFPLLVGIGWPLGRLAHPRHLSTICHPWLAERPSMLPQYPLPIPYHRGPARSTSPPPRRVTISSWLFTLSFDNVGTHFWAFKGDTCGAFSRMRVCTLSLMLSYHILVGALGGAECGFCGASYPKVGARDEKWRFFCVYQKFFIILHTLSFCGSLVQ